MLPCIHIYDSSLSLSFPRLLGSSVFPYGHTIKLHGWLLLTLRWLISLIWFERKFGAFYRMWKCHILYYTVLYFDHIKAVVYYIRWEGTHIQYEIYRLNSEHIHDAWTNKHKLKLVRLFGLSFSWLAGWSGQPKLMSLFHRQFHASLLVRFFFRKSPIASLCISFHCIAYGKNECVVCAVHGLCNSWIYFGVANLLKTDWLYKWILSEKRKKKSNVRHTEKK